MLLHFLVFKLSFSMCVAQRGLQTFLLFVQPSVVQEQINSPDSLILWQII